MRKSVSRRGAQASPFILAVAVSVVLALLSVSCGHGRAGNSANSQLITSNSQRSLDAILAEIDAYPTPKGVDAARFAALKAEVRKQLIARSKNGKTLSVAPTGTLCKVTDLAAVPNAGGTQATIAWTEVLAGDCNNDGEVGIDDLQPIAAHYGETSTGPGSPAYLADANGDRHVDGADLQPIANNYAAQLQGYKVWRGHWDGTATTWEATFRPNVGDPANSSFSADRTASPPATSRPAYTYTDDISTLIDKANVRYEVVAYGDGAEGVASGPAIMPPPGPTYDISGTVLVSGVGMAGVKVTLTPVEVRAVTQADGSYVIHTVSSGSYMLTPLKTAYSFTPATRTVDVSGADVTGQDFTGQAGLANAPWAKFHVDAGNTGRSPYTGTQTNHVRWSTVTITRPVESSPAIGADGTVYVGSDDYPFYALDPANGSMKWLGMTGSGFSSPAIGADGTVYVGGGDNNVYALGPADGSVKWTRLTDSRVESSPAIGADGTVYVGSCDNNVYALNPSDGSVKWSHATAGWVVSSPAIGPDGTIYVGSEDSKVYALNSSDGSVKWTHTTGNGVESSPAIAADGTVYIGSYDGNVYALNPADGSVKWSRPVGNYYVRSSPAIGADGTVYIGSYDYKVYALNPSDGSVEWTYTTGGGVFSSPAIGADGTVYVGSDDYKVYALNPSDGSVKWSYATGFPVRSSPAIGSDGTVYIGSCDDKLYAFGP